MVENGSADGGFSAADFTGQNNKTFPVFNAVEQRFVGLPMTLRKEKEARVGRHVERKLIELEKIEIHKGHLYPNDRTQSIEEGFCFLWRGRCFLIRTNQCFS